MLDKMDEMNFRNPNLFSSLGLPWVGVIMYWGQAPKRHSFFWTIRFPRYHWFEWKLSCRLCVGQWKLLYFALAPLTLEFPNHSRQRSPLPTHLWFTAEIVEIRCMYITRNMVYFSYYRKHRVGTFSFGPEQRFSCSINRSLLNFCQVGWHLGEWQPKTCFYL